MVLTPAQLQGVSGDSLIIPAVDPAGVTFDVFFVGGQSNTGNGEFKDAGLDAPEADIFMYGNLTVTGQNLKVVLASEPVAQSQVIATDKIGFQTKFCKLYKVDNPGKKICIVNSAQGATGFSTGQWVPGGFNYEDFFSRASSFMTAYPLSTVKALLWHQGESDAPTETEASYAAFVDSFFSDFRSNVTGASSSVILTGELADDFVQSNPTQFSKVNDAIIDTPNRISNCGFVSSTSPSILDTYDGTHFNAVAQRTLGQRYYDAYKALT